MAAVAEQRSGRGTDAVVTGIEGRAAIPVFVRELGTTVIAALHDLNLAAMFCYRLCLMNHGRIIAVGRPEEVLTPRLIASAYGIDALTERRPRTGTVWVLPA